jgi:DNA repair photolyase
MALKTTRGDAGAPTKGRGAPSNLEGRYETWTRETADDGWAREEETPRRLETVVTPETAKSIIARNDSPDIPFEQSINPYRGCEHGCSYCYARPSHAYLGLSPGLDFETRIVAKTNAAELLRKELAAPGYRCSAIALGANTDPYQPAEREFRTTRELLEVLLEHRHPVTVVTKGALILRDLDLLAELAARRLASVAVSLTTLDDRLKRCLEPRAAAPQARLRVIRALVGAGVPVTVLVAPVIPALNDHELESLVEAAAVAGGCRTSSARSSSSGCASITPSAPTGCSTSCATCAAAGSMTRASATGCVARAPMRSCLPRDFRPPAAVSDSTSRGAPTSTARSSCATRRHPGRATCSADSHARIQLSYRALDSQCVAYTRVVR